MRQAAEPAEPASVEKSEPPARTRKPLPEHLPRNDTVLTSGEAFACCGGALRCSGG